MSANEGKFDRDLPIRAVSIGQALLETMMHFHWHKPPVSSCHQVQVLLCSSLLAQSRISCSRVLWPVRVPEA